MTFSAQPSHPPLKTSAVTKYSFKNILHKYHKKESNYKRPTMISLFDKNRQYYNQNNKTFHLVSHMAFKAAPLIGRTEPSNSDPGSSDGHAQPLGQLRNNLKVGQNMQHQIRLKVQHKLYYSQRYVSPTVAEAILNLFLTHF